MSDFWLDVILCASGFLFVLAVVYLPVLKGRIEAIKRQRQKIAEYEDRLKKAGAAIANLEKEIYQKDKLIDDMVAEHKDQVKRAAVLENDILRLRRELKKRTDQYNELVDLAREKGIIGE